MHNFDRKFGCIMHIFAGFRVARCLTPEGDTAPDVQGGFTYLVGTATRFTISATAFHSLAMVGFSLHYKAEDDE